MTGKAHRKNVGKSMVSGEDFPVKTNPLKLVAFLYHDYYNHQPHSMITV